MEKPTSQKYEKLKTLLRELFQLDQPDLDFDLYRIIRAKSAAESQVFDENLLPQAKAAFGAYEPPPKRRSRRSASRRLRRRRLSAQIPSRCPRSRTCP